MNNQCVPRWDLDETVGAGLNPVPAGSAQRMASGDSGLTEPVAMPMPDQYDEVAELTWEKGNIFWQGLFNRSVPKYPAAPGRGESSLLTLEPCGTGADDLCGFTTTNNSTSLDQGSPETENTSFGGGASDSRCFSRRSQRDGLCDEAENVVVKGEAPMRSAISTKRSRAAAIHNESERKRRDRINQKMQTLQKLVPNSSKTDKASMLDEVIDHLKQLQATVQMMNRMSSMMMPMAMPQLAQMSVMTQMAQMAQMAQMGLGMMNMAAGPLAQPAYPGLAQPMMHPSTPFAAAGGLRGGLRRARPGGAMVLPGGGARPRRAGRIPHALRLELGAGERVGRRAHALLPAAHGPVHQPAARGARVARRRAHR